MSSYSVAIAQSPSEMDALAPLWNSLLRDQEHTTFQSFSWNRLAAAVFADRLTPFVVSVESESGAAIIPAAIHKQKRRVELLGEVLFDYRDVLHLGDAGLLLAAWRTIAARSMPLHVLAIDEVGRDTRWESFSAKPFANAPQVFSTSTTEDAFRLAHSRLGRQTRRLAKQGIVLRTYAGSESKVVRHLYDCKRTHFATDESDNVFLDQKRCHFMVEVAALEGPRCEIYTLEKDAQLVAGLVTFLDGRVRRFYTIYFNPEWARYSPGQALLYEITARSLGRGLSCDYMTGEYSYKLRLANGSRRLYEVNINSQRLAEIAHAPAQHAA
jgi:CelD/BcsL family acetyltransferase involved in cellulose biosynthesis